MRRTFLALSALTIAATPGFAKEAPVVLAPKGEWEFLAEGGTCTAARMFDNGGQDHVLILKQFGPSDAFGLSVYGPALRPFINLQPTELRFYEGQKENESTPFTAVLQGFDKGVVYGSVTPDWDELVALAKAGKPAYRPFRQLDPEFGRKIAFVGLKQGSRPEVQVATGSMEGVFQSLNGCTSALVEKSGIDTARLGNALREPILQDWRETWGALRDAYRRYALEGERGVIVLRATISAEGKMDSCELVDAATSGKLAPAICEIMGKAEFQPAIDAQGQPFRAFYVQTLRFQTQ